MPRALLRDVSTDVLFAANDVGKAAVPVPTIAEVVWLTGKAEIVPTLTVVAGAVEVPLTACVGAVPVGKKVALATDVGAVPVATMEKVVEMEEDVVSGAVPGLVEDDVLVVAGDPVFKPDAYKAAGTSTAR